jgi:hypothetical protein
MLLPKYSKEKFQDQSLEKVVCHEIHKSGLYLQVKQLAMVTQGKAITRIIVYGRTYTLVFLATRQTKENWAAWTSRFNPALL